MIESLEGRRLLSTVHPAGVFDDGLPPGGSVATTIVLTKAQVIGNYKGSAVVTGTTTTIPLKLTIRATSASLTVTGYGKVTVPISSKQLHKLRDGAFNLSVTAAGLTFKLNGSVIKSGTRITGTFSTTGVTIIAGTFSLKKY